MPNPPRPSDGDLGNVPDVIAAQDIWDALYDPKRSLFVDGEGLPLRFTKGKDGKYTPVLKLPVSRPQTETFFPFKIYHGPPNDTASDWRTFRVRAGQVGLVGVTGTDDTDTNPDDITNIPAYDGDIDFVVPDATAIYYVWIDCTDPATPTIDHSATPPSTPSGFSSPWQCGQYILIGKIDTNTYTATKKAVVRQLVRADLPEYLKTITCIEGVEKTIYLPGRLA